jgi:hypothetical protein
MLRRAIAFVLLLPLAGCEAVLDFGGYVATPATCDPIHPAGATSQSFVTCGAEQCGRANGEQTFSCETGGAGADGAHCASDADCAAGLGCDATGHCHAWCASAADCAAGVCDPANVPYGDAGTLGFCGTPCTLANATECAGEQCASTPAGPRCEGSPGVVADYEPCASDEDCAIGSGCQTIGQALSAGTTPPDVKRCQAWCDGACNTPETCVKGVGPGYCYAPCDVLGRSGPVHACSQSERCSFVNAGGKPTATVCESPSSVALAEDNACAGEADCLPKEACRGFDHGLFCEGYCDLANGDGDCAPGRTCEAFSNARQAAGTTFGFCIGPTCDPLDPSALCVGATTCSLLDDGYAACRPDPTPIPIGQPCTAKLFQNYLVDSCAPGSECLGSSDLGYFCRAYCRLNQSDCPTNATCHALATTYSLEGATWGYCAPPPCDPRNASDGAAPFTACANGDQCRFDTSSTTICVAPTGNAPPGAACTKDTDCESDAFCVHFGATATCEKLCRVGTSDCSGIAPKCDAFNNAADEIFGVQYGYCGN